MFSISGICTITILQIVRSIREHKIGIPDLVQHANNWIAEHMSKRW